MGTTMDRDFFAKGSEPENIKKRIKILMPKLLSAYPDRVIVHLERDHKKWAETVRDISKKLGYADSAEFLFAYGFRVEKPAVGGRPSTTTANAEQIIEELKRRYPDGPHFQSVHTLISANLDLKGQLKTLQNIAPQVFGVSFKAYLRQANLIGDVIEKRFHREATEDNMARKVIERRVIGQEDDSIRGISHESFDTYVPNHINNKIALKPTRREQTMEKINELFRIRVDTLLSNSSGKTVFFFKGFSFPQLHLLIDHPNSILNDRSLLKDGALNLVDLNERWLDLVTAIQTAVGPMVGFYEELLVLQDFLPRIQVDSIVVIENNTLSPWTPSLLPWEQAVELFDYIEGDSNPSNPYIETLVKFYGDVKILSNERALVIPVTVESESIATIPFWNGESTPQQITGDVKRIEIGGQDDWEYRYDLLLEELEPALFLSHGKALTQRQIALSVALSALGVEHEFRQLTRSEERKVYDEAPFLPFLKKHWGESATFRPLLFYKDPDLGHETESIPQGQIIAEIAEQAENAHNGKSFCNVFITAPTGSGKSILFQIPSLYLAEKYGLVTIVVSPLIALMNDQIDQLKNERGVTSAACINSTMSIDERMQVIADIQSGQKSLLYLAPELLLTTHLPTFLGGRKLGLVVIDEAHTVTSWGRDFRSDYWFLGDFLKKANRNGMTFPVLCLTATAVYSGEDDVVNDTIRELGLERTIIHLGNVKRDNIAFDICVHDRSEIDGNLEEKKRAVTLERMRSYIAKGEKVLTYFPFRRQVEEMYASISVAEHGKLRRYHGQLPSPERKMAERSYKTGEALGLFCTKAFGMGIDVSDIKHVIHFAPSGTIADYVQEIGRAARNNDIQGIAHIDFFPGDARYARSLFGISEMRQYQVREILKKLCAIYNTKKHRNLLISAETFEYLFAEKDVENKTKSGLMLLAKDLSYKFSFPVLIVRPKAMLSKNYVCVNFQIEELWLKKYGKYATLQKSNPNRTVLSMNSGASDTSIIDAGNIYLVDMARIWEDCFPELAFGMFKQEFFKEEFRSGKEVYHAAPRLRVQIRYIEDYQVVCEKMKLVADALVSVFEQYKRADKKQFTLRQFEIDMEKLVGERVVPHEKASLFLDIFTEDTNEDVVFTKGRNAIRVLRKRKQAGTDETVYFVSSPSFAQLNRLIIRYLMQCNPNVSGDTFHRFYPLVKDKPIEIMPLLRLLEIMGMANYEIRGGEKAEVFVRINDPSKLQRLANGRYVNAVLQSIQEHHSRSIELLSAFFQIKMEDNDRWELIEQYFLGNEDYVRTNLMLEGK